VRDKERDLWGLGSLPDCLGDRGYIRNYRRRENRRYRRSYRTKRCLDLVVVIHLDLFVHFGSGEIVESWVVFNTLRSSHALFLRHAHGPPSPQSSLSRNSATRFRIQQTTSSEHKPTSHFKVNVDIFVNAFLALSLSARVLAAFKIGSLSGFDPLTGIIVWWKSSGASLIGANVAAS